MSHPDLNLLVTLDVLLAEGSVAGAARRLRLSPSAMSRALARLRETTGDPLLVRAGRGLVPTPRALELREHVGALVREAQAALRPSDDVDLARLARTFILRNSDGFVETFGARLIARIAHDAPGVRLRFLAKIDKESTPLRNGSVDLETGVVGSETSPELRVQSLFTDTYVGVVRRGHPLVSGTVTPASFAAGRHILVARRERGSIDRIDGALEPLGLRREIAVVVGGFSQALALARASDLVASVPRSHTRGLRESLHTFTLPLDVPDIVISMLWHPRLNADPAHRWLRGCLREVCAQGTA